MYAIAFCLLSNPPQRIIVENEWIRTPFSSSRCGCWILNFCPKFHLTCELKILRGKKITESAYQRKWNIKFRQFQFNGLHWRNSFGSIPSWNLWNHLAKLTKPRKTQRNVYIVWAVSTMLVPQEIFVCDREKTMEKEFSALLRNGVILNASRFCLWLCQIHRLMIHFIK